jgi:hypothetical protein
MITMIFIGYNIDIVRYLAMESIKMFSKTLFSFELGVGGQSFPNTASHFDRQLFRVAICVLMMTSRSQRFPDAHFCQF